MNDVSDLDRVEEDILTNTVSDEALEFAVGIEKGEGVSILPPQSDPCLLSCLVRRD